MASTKNLGIVKPVPKGDWSEYVEYEELNIVSYNKESYIALSGSIGIAPGVANGWQSYWQLLTSGETINILSSFQNTNARLSLMENDISSLSNKTQDNANNITALKSVLETENIMAVATVEQAYSTRQTANGLDIFNGGAEILKIQGSTVASKNLYSINNVTVSSENGQWTLQQVKTISVPFRTDLTISVCFNQKGTDKSTVALSIRDANNPTYTIAETVTSTATDGRLVCSFNTGDYSSVLIIVYSNWTANYLNTSCNFHSFQVEYGSIATDYVPYFKGLKDAAISRIRSTGKNLIPSESIDRTETINGVSFTRRVDGSVLVKGTATAQAVFYISTKINASGRIVVSGAPTTSSTETHFLEAQARGEYDNALYISSTGSYNATKEIIRVDSVYIIVRAGVTVDNQVYYPMLEYGETASEYEQYKEDIYSISMEQSLGLGESIYPQKGIKKSCGRTIVFDGTTVKFQEVGSGTFSSGGSYYYARYNLQQTAKANAPIIASNGFINSNTNKLYPKTVYSWAGGKSISFQFINDKFVESDISTLEKANAYLKNLYDNGNPLTVRYEAVEEKESYLSIPTTYLADKGGSETVLQGDEDNSQYGAMPTVTQEYFAKVGE